MKLPTSHAARLRGTSRYRQASPDRKVLSPPRLMVQTDPWFGPHELLESEESGFVLPGESAQDNLAMFAAIDALSSPADSVFTLHFQTEGGQREKVVHHYDGMQSVVSLPISKAWTRAAIGRHFSLDYQVEWPDGTRLDGARISIRVHPIVEISPIHIEGVGFGEPIDPALLPDSILFNVARMRNAEFFHNARFRLLLQGATPGGFISPILDIYFPLPNIGESPYTVMLQKWHLIKPYEEGWTDLRLQCLSHMVLAPPPNIPARWGQLVQMGVNHILPPVTRR